MGFCREEGGSILSRGLLSFGEKGGVMTISLLSISKFPVWVLKISLFGSLGNLPTNS